MRALTGRTGPVVRVLKWLAIVLLALALAFLALIAWPVASAPLPQRNATTLIDNVRIVDVLAGTSGEPTRILIHNGRIAAIGTDLTVPPDAFRIDARGKFVMPGLWDMHSHSWQVSPQLHLPLQLASGVTAVRDMMGCPEADDPLIACHVDKQRWTASAGRGEMASPRFVADASFFYEDAALTPDAVRARLQEDARSGVDLLKVYNRLPKASYEALMQASRQAGLEVVGHLPRAVPLDGAIAAGQHSFEHGRIFIEGCFADAARWRRGALDSLPRPVLLRRMLEQRDQTYCDAQMARMAESGAAFVPTLVTREEDARAPDPAFMDDPRLVYADPLSRWAYRDDASTTLMAYASPQDRALLERTLQQAMADTLSAYRAGVPVLVGSDTIIAGPRLHDELGLLAEAGLTNAEVLRAATLDAARFMRAQRNFGTIEPGKVADLIILSADPLADIRNTRKLAGVMLNGHYYDAGGLAELKAFVQQQAGHPSNWARMIWGFLTSSAGSSL